MTDNTIRAAVAAVDLKPCPFCGSSKVGLASEHDGDTGGVFLSIKCSGCRASSGAGFSTDPCPQTYQEVRDEWNRRAAHHIPDASNVGEGQAEGARSSLSERLIDAIEGVLEGRGITAEQASEILAYLQYGSSMHDTRRDAERYRKLRDADINAIHKGGVFAGLTPDNVVINGEDLDIAVDFLIDGPTSSTGDQEVGDGL